MQSLRHSRSNLSIKARFSTHGQSDSWHRQVSLEAGDHHPIGQGYVPNPSFPWANLRQITDSYLSKKRGKNVIEDRDARLGLLIKSHGAKDVAIASCGHAISPKALRELLAVDLNIEQGSAYGLASYLQAIVAANHVNEGAVSSLEAQRAIELMASSNTSTARYLEALLQILIHGVPSNFLIYPHIQTLARLACVEFAAQVEELRRECQWHRAQAATEWLSRFELRSVEASPENLNSIRLLHANFPNWRAWAMWSPDVARLGRWELFSPDQRLTLSNILLLEGPDFISKRHTTFREAVEAQGFDPSLTRHSVGSIIFEVERGSAPNIPDMVHRLLNLVDAAVVTSPRDDAALLAYFCFTQSVTNKRLDCLASLSSLADPMISALVSRAYRAQNETRAISMVAVVKLLPFLGTERCGKKTLTTNTCLQAQLLAPAPFTQIMFQATRSFGIREATADAIAAQLHRAIGADVVNLVRATLHEMQRILLSQIQSGQSSTDTELRLQACGSAFLRTPWLRSSLDSSLVKLFNDWPSLEDVGYLHSIRDLAKMSSTGNMWEIVKNVDEYMINCLVQSGTILTGTKILVKALLTLWKRAADSDRRWLALSVVQSQIITTNFRCRCLNQLPQLPDGFVYSLRLIIQNYDEAPDVTCIDLATLLAANETSMTCWRPILMQMLDSQGQKLIDYALANLHAYEWVQLLSNLRKVFEKEMKDEPISSVAILHPELYRLVSTLDMYLPIISQLETDVRCMSAVRCIFIGGDGLYGHLVPTLEKMLWILTFKMNEHSKSAMFAVMSLLEVDGSNASEVSSALSSLIVITAEGCDACLNILEAVQNHSPEVAEVVFAGWLEAPSLTADDHDALHSVAVLLGIRPSSNQKWSEAGLERLIIVKGYLDVEYAQLFAEAQRLEENRSLLKSIDPQGTAQLLESVGIEDISLVDDALASLPPALVSVVERLDDTSLEMHFPLGHVTELQRVRFGICKAQSLFLHFVLADDPAFCLHFDRETKGKHTVGYATSAHDPWRVIPGGEHPDLPICQGQTSPAKYHIARAISRHLIEGFKSLEAIHVLVTGVLKELGKSCITCGKDHGVRLRCPTTCSSQGCRSTFLQASLEVRLCQIRQDPAAIDCLLSMVYSAASTGKLELLPHCPFNSTATVLQVLKLVPAMSYLQTCDGLAETIRSYSPKVEQLLVWVCTAYRGFLASAQGPVRIPSLPAGTHQFLLANHSPEHEAAFSRHITRNARTRVLFHGTSLERLFAIACQGLRVLSNTPLQAHGRASGAGVYCAEEPSTSWAYCAGQGQGNWANSQFNNVRALLGLEIVGPSVGASGVHVVQDASTLCVRYMFLIPAGNASVPIAAHITPAMTSVYASLRSGAL